MKPESQKLLIVAGVAIVGAYLLWRASRAGFDAISGADVDEGGSQQGGLLVGVSDAVFGQPTFSRTVGSSSTPLSGAVTPRGKPSSNPLDGITGSIIDPRSGGRVDRALWSSTIRWKAEIVNANGSPWTGVLRFDVDEDYLVGDTKGTYSKTVTVPARSALQVDIDYQLQGGAHVREPDLLVAMFAGSKMLASEHEIVVT